MIHFKNFQYSLRKTRDPVINLFKCSLMIKIDCTWKKLIAGFILIGYFFLLLSTIIFLSSFLSCFKFSFLTFYIFTEYL